MIELCLQCLVVPLLLTAAVMALIHGLKFREDVRTGKAAGEDDAWWGVM
jgi:hypothetical protein